jgi:NAD(P)-dependent dehydrogenase (short-subunit alcohol dehydrogenase family)
MRHHVQQEPTWSTKEYLVNDLFDLTGKVAVVTGGTRGLGKEMARAFARAGAVVVIASRKQDACDHVAAELREETGQRVVGLALHVGRWDDLETFVQQVLTLLGRIDILVNNAGLSPVYDEITSVSEDLFDKVIDVNLKGPFRLSALVATHMIEYGGGSIINITSAGAVHPRPDILPYAAAKAGLNALTVGMARAYGPTVRVNAIMAGTFLTDISKAWSPEAFAKRAATFALQRGGRPDEIVGTALYLASEASSYTTGAVVTVDGGQP